MPKTPAKAISYGDANLGQATRLQSEAPNLFGLLQYKEAQKERGEAAKRKQDLERGKQLSKDLEYSPDKVWAPYTDWQIKKHKKLIDKVAKSYSGGQFPSSEQQGENAKERAELDADTNRINGFKQSVDALNKAALSDDEINEEAVHTALGSATYSDKGTLVDPSTLDKETIDNLYEDPNIYNQPKIVSNFAKLLHEDIFSLVKETPGGHDEITVKSKFLEFDDAGNQIFDPATGEPIIKVSPETLNLAKNQPRMALMIEKSKAEIVADEGRTDVTDMEAFTKLVKPFAYAQEKINREGDAYKRQLLKQRQKRGRENELIIERKRLIDAAQKGHGWALDSFKQGKYNNKIIRDVEYDTSGKDATIVLTLVNNKGKESTETLSLGADVGGSFNVLNTIVNTITGQEKFSMEDLTKAPKVTPSKKAQEIDIDALNADISTIQNNPEAGTVLLEELVGDKKIEYEDGILTIGEGDLKKLYDLTSPKSYDKLKDLILKKNRKKYTITPVDKNVSITEEAYNSLQAGDSYWHEGVQYTKGE